MKLKPKNLILAVFAMLFLSSCATNRGVISLSVPEAKKAEKSNGKEIFIRSVTDNRVFEERPASPSTPSLGFGGSKQSSVELKKRAVARKRNTYGKALGDIVLKEGQTVETIVRDSLSRSFAELGYKVLSKETQATKNTIVVDASINKFWSWMSIGFWTIGLTSEIDVKVTVKDRNETKEIFSTYEGRFLAAGGKNWIKVMTTNLDGFNEETKKVLGVELRK